MSFTVYVNGESQPLLNDLRFFMLDKFPPEYVLYDLQTVPPTPIEVYLDAPEAGVTKRKLLPNGNYAALIRGPDSELYLSHAPVCLFVLRVPARCTSEMLWVFFSKFGDVKEAYVIPNHGTSACNGRGVVIFCNPATLQTVPKHLPFTPDFPHHELVVELGYRLPDPLKKEEEHTEKLPESSWGNDEVMSFSPYRVRNRNLDTGHVPPSNHQGSGGNASSSDLGMDGVRSRYVGTSSYLSSPPTPLLSSSPPRHPPVPNGMSVSYPSSSSPGSGIGMEVSSLGRSSSFLTPSQTYSTGSPLQPPIPVSFPSSIGSFNTISTSEIPRRKKVPKKAVRKGDPESPPTPSPPSPVVTFLHSPPSHGYIRGGFRKGKKFDGTGKFEDVSDAGHACTTGITESFLPPFGASFSSPYSQNGFSNSSFSLSSVSRSAVYRSGCASDCVMAPKNLAIDRRVYVVHFSSDKEAQTAVKEQCFFPFCSSEIAQQTTGDDRNGCSHMGTSSGEDTHGSHPTITNETHSTSASPGASLFAVFTVRKGTTFFGLARVLRDSVNEVLPSTSSAETRKEGGEKGSVVKCPLQWICESVNAPIPSHVGEFSEVMSCISGSELLPAVGEKVLDYMHQCDNSTVSGLPPSSYSSEVYHRPSVGWQEEYGRVDQQYSRGFQKFGPLPNNRNKNMYPRANHTLRERGGMTLEYAPRRRGFGGRRGGGPVLNDRVNNFYSDPIQGGQGSNGIKEEVPFLPSANPSLMEEKQLPPKPIM